MIFPFMLIRKFSGGFHLKSQNLCIAFSTVLLLFAIKLIKHLEYSSHKSLLTVPVLISTICIFIFSPVECTSRKLTSKEQRMFQIIARILATLAFVCYITMHIIAPIRYALAFGVGIILVAALQLTAIIPKFKPGKNCHIGFDGKSQS